MLVDTMAGPYKARAAVAKYNDGRTPDDGDPDEVVVVEGWFEADGMEVTDPQRIAEIEAMIARNPDANQAR